MGKRDREHYLQLTKYGSGRAQTIRLLQVVDTCQACLDELHPRQLNYHIG